MKVAQDVPPFAAGFFGLPTNNGDSCDSCDSSSEKSP